MNRTADILLFGGTGHLGRDVIQTLLPIGFSMRVASRRPRPNGTHESLQWAETDLATGHGVEEGIMGVRHVVFCAGNPKQHALVEVEGMRRLLDAARKADVGHFVFVSIVGIDQLPAPYYQTKLAAERLIRESGVPYTILRATQFHYFVALLFTQLARIPLVMPVPKGFRVQSVATEDVAARLARCLGDGPQGLVSDFCGPEILSLREAALLWRDARGLKKRVLPIHVPGKIGEAFRGGHNTNPQGELGTVRWSEWLAQNYGQSEKPPVMAAR